MHCPSPAVLLTLLCWVVMFTNCPLTEWAVMEADKVFVPENTSESQQLKQKGFRMLWSYFNRGNSCFPLHFHQLVQENFLAWWTRLNPACFSSETKSNLSLERGDTNFSLALESGFWLQLGNVSIEHRYSSPIVIHRWCEWSHNVQVKAIGWWKLQPGRPATSECSRNSSDSQAQPQQTLLILNVGGILGAIEVIPLRAQNTEKLEAWVFFFLLCPVLLSDLSLSNGKKLLGKALLCWIY